MCHCCFCSFLIWQIQSSIAMVHDILDELKSQERHFSQPGDPKVAFRNGLYLTYKASVND